MASTGGDDNEGTANSSTVVSFIPHHNVMTKSSQYFKSEYLIRSMFLARIIELFGGFRDF
jgi:hypothetical protein